MPRGEEAAEAEFLENEGCLHGGARGGPPPRAWVARSPRIRGPPAPARLPCVLLGTPVAACRPGRLIGALWGLVSGGVGCLWSGVEWGACRVE